MAKHDEYGTNTNPPQPDIDQQINSAINANPIASQDPRSISYERANISDRIPVNPGGNTNSISNVVGQMSNVAMGKPVIDYAGGVVRDTYNNGFLNTAGRVLRDAETGAANLMEGGSNMLDRTGKEISGGIDNIAAGYRGVDPGSVQNPASINSGETIDQATASMDRQLSDDKLSRMTEAESNGLSTIQGAGGETIYKNTNVDESKYGKAIYSNNSLGAMTDAQGGTFNSDLQKNGVGATGLDENGEPTGTYTPFSSPVQSPEIQQKAGGIEMAGQNPVGNGSPYGQNQYGNTGQGTNGITTIGQGSANARWFANRGNKQRFRDRLPYGSPGDRAKRKSMIADRAQQALEAQNIASNQLSSERNSIDQQRVNATMQNNSIKNNLDERRLGIDEYNAGSSRITANRGGSKKDPYRIVDGGYMLDKNGNIQLDNNGEPMTSRVKLDQSTGRTTSVSNRNTPPKGSESVMAEVAKFKQANPDKPKETQALYNKLMAEQGRK